MAPVDQAEVMTMDLEDGDDDMEAGFNINRAFASKYEEKKKREEIGNLQEKYGGRFNRFAEEEESESDSESDEEEDENGELLSKELDVQIMKTIGLIRSKKPEVYDPTKKFFSPEELAKSRIAWNEKQNAAKAEGKKVTLKDYHRERLLKGEANDEDDDEAEIEEPVTKTYIQEQEELRQSFKSALVGDEDEDDEDDFLTTANSKSDSNKGGLFTVRSKTQDELDKEEADYKAFLLQNIKQGDVADGLKDWTEFAEGKEDAVEDPSEKFLMSFILNKGWVDEDADESAIPTYDQIVKDEHIDQDEAEEEEVDRFERAYNFRFEESDGANIVTHARTIEDSMRRKDTRRADKRLSIKERKEEEKRAKAEELKRLKNLKKEEMLTKLKKIAEVAGTETSTFEHVDLDEEFDASKFDEMMAARFDDEYYASGEGADLEKPVFDDGLDLDDIEDYDYDEEDDAPPPYNQEEDDFDMDADFLPGGELYGDESQTGKKTKKDKKKELREKKKKDKKEAANAEDNLLKNIDEYLGLDYEDMIGDMPTRFKYRKVEADDYGVSAVDILMAPETALNELVPLKHIAPFRPEMRKARDQQIWAKTKKKKVKKFKDALEAARAGKTLEQWEEEKRKEKREAAVQEKKALGQAAKKAAKRAKRAAMAAATGTEVDSSDANGANSSKSEEREDAMEQHDDVADEQPMDVLSGGEAVEVEQPKKKEHKKTNHVNKKRKIVASGKGDGKSDSKKGTGKTDGKGGISSDRLASYAMPSRKK
ncbi:KRI1-like family C-terminal-domain-containing protein [Chytriomyces cf. hyalinus JEL632]|nr:KRI1-like family C-terminal-domain-containing protein [Chytriomyces cf. hyalinus JEL632]